MGRSKEGGCTPLSLPLVGVLIKRCCSFPFVSWHPESDGYVFVLQVGYTVTKELYNYTRERDDAANLN
jgi:hypothetical protein